MNEGADSLLLLALILIGGYLFISNTLRGEAAEMAGRSVAWDTSGRKMRYNGNMLLAFADAVRQVDAVVTDRLHVAIMCWKAGVEVYMLDNSYHKLSGVYRKSLSNEPSVHLLATGRFTPELERAWKRLNSPARLLRLRAETARRRGVGKLKNAAKRLLRH